MELEKRDRESVPMVIEWAAGNVACHVARNDTSRHACQSLHSECTDSSVGRGHICHCLPGYQGNPYLVDGCQDINECAVSKPCIGVCINLPGSFKCYCPKGFIGDGRKDGTGCHPKDQVNWPASIYFPLAIFVLAPALASTWIFWTHRNKKLGKHRMNLFEQNGGNLLMHKLSRRKKSANMQMKIYTAEDMKKATSNYSSSRVIQRCRPGTFYRGILADNDQSEVVIMKIQRVPESQIEQFVDQLIFLSQPHRNLVKIMGCCLETGCPLLVYELHGDGTGTLFDHIYDEALVSRFSCEMRVKAAAGAARALAYMHSHKSRATLVHGNISSANIFLDDSYDAKIFYAAASSLIPRDISLSEQENYVYRDPEFISSGQLNEKSDVYSFGVVLAELLTGGKAFAPDRQENDRNLALDFTSLVKKGLPEILNDQLITERDARQVKEVATLATRCLSVKSEERPKMKEVEAKLSALI
ncbi:hypothetical protein Pfo_017205 [Paulownia fortunei]|nr:hypothetical protein Pfo_017205 [Paulownia fortunei]